MKSRILISLLIAGRAHLRVRLKGTHRNRYNGRPDIIHRNDNRTGRHIDSRRGGNIR